MIHINVRSAGGDLRSSIVETSTDGGGWAEQYQCAVTDDGMSARENGEYVARIFANGCRYAGAEVRMTSYGEELLRV